MNCKKRGLHRIKNHVFDELRQKRGLKGLKTTFSCSSSLPTISLVKDYRKLKELIVPSIPVVTLFLLVLCNTFVFSFYRLRNTLFSFCFLFTENVFQFLSTMRVGENMWQVYFYQLKVTFSKSLKALQPTLDQGVNAYLFIDFISSLFSYLFS